MWETLIPAGISALGGLFGAKDQSDTVKEAADQANALEREQWDWTKQAWQPRIDAGNRGLTLYERAIAQKNQKPYEFTADPGYQFRLGEGEKAINRAAAASGRFDSGRTLKDLLRYGQDFASNEYGQGWNRWNTLNNQNVNRLANLAGLGQTALTQVGGAGQNYADSSGSNLANAMLMGANARGNAWTGVGNTLGKAFGSMYQQPQQSAAPNWSGSFNWSPYQYDQSWQYE